jgi:hypothetical protein
MVDQRIADANCVSSHDYTKQQTKTQTNKPHATKEKEPTERKLGDRKFYLE